MLTVKFIIFKIYKHVCLFKYYFRKSVCRSTSYPIMYQRTVVKKRCPHETRLLSATGGGEVHGGAPPLITANFGEMAAAAAAPHAPFSSSCSAVSSGLLPQSSLPLELCCSCRRKRGSPSWSRRRWQRCGRRRQLPCAFSGIPGGGRRRSRGSWPEAGFVRRRSSSSAPASRDSPPPSPSLGRAPISRSMAASNPRFPYSRLNRSRSGLACAR